MRKRKENKERFNSFIIDSIKYRTQLTEKFKSRKSWLKPDDKFVNTFIPGTIDKIFVYEGQHVKEGDNLFILEAMKMKNEVVSPISGRIKKIYIVQGDVVEKNKLAIEFD